MANASWPRIADRAVGAATGSLPRTSAAGSRWSALCRRKQGSGLTGRTKTIGMVEIADEGGRPRR